MNNNSMKSFMKYNSKDPDIITEEHSSNKNKEHSIGNYNEKEETDSNVKFSSVNTPETSNMNISSKQLQEAIIWSEILGKPLCKRRKRR